MRLQQGKALFATPDAIDLLQNGGSFFNFPRSAQVDGAILTAQSASYALIYATQPHVRTVVDYMARTAVSRTLSLLERQPNGDKIEVPMHAAARTLRRPNDWQGTKEFLDSVIRDALVYDNAYVWDMGVNDGDSRYLVRIPPYAIEVASEDTLRPKRFRLWFRNGTYLDLKPEEVIHFRGYSATSNRLGVSPLETLRQQLVEEAARQAQAIDFVRGGMVKGGIIERPIEAPEWGETARGRFESDWAARLRGVNAGKSPVLEEGMKFVDAGVTPHDAEAARSREYSLAAVCRLYGLHPGLFGVEGTTVVLDSARDAADEDVVVPMLMRVAETLTVQLVGRFYGDDDTHSFAFGPRAETSIEKLAKAGKDAVTTVMTIDEFRRIYLNLPPLPDGHGAQLLMNPGAVLGGAPPVPVTTDRGRPVKAEDPPGKATEPEGKAQLLARRARSEQRRNTAAAEHTAIFQRHFRRQYKHMAEGGRVLNAPRWNEELAADLLRLARKTVSQEGALQAERFLGTFDMTKVENYLRAGAEAAAGAINAQTANDIAAAQTHAAQGGKAGVAQVAALGVLDDMISNRAEGLGFGRATQLLAFASFESGKQTTGAGEIRLKTWIGSGLPDSRHSGISGESVPLFSPFSNGLQYPSDPNGSAGQTAHCKCLLDVHH